MKKAHKISLLFLLIFLFGLIGFIASINLSLNKKSQVNIKSAQLYMDRNISDSNKNHISFIIFLNI
ncbi:hypothetical protein APR41_01075 [Salegentibacter salinarum]|uniref:Uncharacterized protein n=1 Tax=Salegentibacter salinarum TaxID=447422 RepID=A0A2N0U3L0_9FLAO|nr:hypothetical protein APR41_01075 [Salegentibacter salinarum]